MSDEAETETPAAEAAAEHPEAEPDSGQGGAADASDAPSNGNSSPGVGEPDVAGGDNGPGEGTYVPQRGSGTPPATSAQPDSAGQPDEKVESGAAERSAERIRAAQSGKTVSPDDEPKNLDLGRDAGYNDPAGNQKIAQQSRLLVTQSIDNEKGSMTFGPYSPAVTQIVTVMTGTSQVTVLKGTFSAEQLERMRRPHVRVAGFEAMQQTLGDQGLIVLRGPEGSGRQATAVNLLAELNLLHIGTLDVGRDIALRDVYDKDLLERDHGYVLEIAGIGQRSTLDAFSALARQATARLVIITSAAQSADEPLDRYAFDHQPASPDTVLQEHLVYALDHHICEDGCTEQSKTEYVKTRLADIAGMKNQALPTQRWALVELAHRIAAGIHDGVATEILVKRDRTKLRRSTIDALTIDDEEGKVEASRHQGFRIAYAVFNECSLADVLKAGDLFGQVLPLFETREKTPDHVAFDGKIENLLAPDMRLEHSPGQAGQVDIPRRAVLADPALTGIFLDVVWNDFDALRTPVLVWLDLLAGSDRPPIQIRAAHAAGLLATFDFDELYRVLIGAWARGSLIYRQSAAHALHAAAGDTRLADRIRRQVRDWADSPNPRLQDSAARAYGRLVGVSSHEDGVRALRTLGAKPELVSSASIAIGMANLFAVAPQETLQELALWNSGDNVNRRRHAGRALMLLARFAGPKASGGWPAMSSLVAEDVSLEQTLAKMWADALISTDTARGAWEPLRKWIMAADTDPDLAEMVVRLAIQMFSGANERAVFHLTYWRHKYPESLVLKRVHDAIVPSSYQRGKTDSRS